jgi:hypothetical protein
VGREEFMSESLEFELAALRRTIEKLMEQQEETNDINRTLADAVKALAQELRDPENPSRYS